MVGEIGGDEEEKAAAFIESEMSKPVVAYIAGFTAPPGKTMGHAGAIISGSAGTAQAKKDALEAKGIRVGRPRPRPPSSSPRSPAPSRRDRRRRAGAHPVPPTPSSARRRARRGHALAPRAHRRDLCRRRGLGGLVARRVAGALPPLARPMSPPRLGERRSGLPFQMPCSPLRDTVPRGPRFPPERHSDAAGTPSLRVGSARWPSRRSRSPAARPGPS